MNDIPAHVADYLHDQELILTLFTLANGEWIASISNDEETERSNGDGPDITSAVQAAYEAHQIDRYVADQIKKMRGEA